MAVALQSVGTGHRRALSVDHDHDSTPNLAQTLNHAIAHASQQDPLTLNVDNMPGPYALLVELDHPGSDYDVGAADKSIYQGPWVQDAALLCRRPASRGHKHRTPSKSVSLRKTLGSLILP